MCSPILRDERIAAQLVLAALLLDLLLQRLLVDPSQCRIDEQPRASMEAIANREVLGRTIEHLEAAAAPSGGFNSVVPTASWWSSMLQLMLPIALFLGVMWWLVGRMSGGRGGAMGFGRSKAKVGQKEMDDRSEERR